MRTFLFYFICSAAFVSCKFGPKKVMSDENSLLLAQKGTGILLTPHVLDESKETDSKLERVCAYKVSGAENALPKISQVNERSVEYKLFLTELFNRKNEFDEIFPNLHKAVFSFKQRVAKWFMQRLENWETRYHASAKELKSARLEDRPKDDTIDFLISEMIDYAGCLDWDGSNSVSPERKVYCGEKLKRDLTIGFNHFVIKKLPVVKAKIWTQLKVEAEVENLATEIRSFDIQDSSKDSFTQKVLSQKKSRLLGELINELALKTVDTSNFKVPTCPDDKDVFKKYFNKSGAASNP